MTSPMSSLPALRRGTRAIRHVFCLRGPWVAVLALVLAGGCVANSALAPPTGANHSETAVSAASGASSDLAAAKGLIQSGRYSQAIPRLLHVVSARPGDAVAAEAHYYLGLSYRALESPADAQRHFEETLRFSPGGALEEHARRYLNEIHGVGTEPPVAQEPAYVFDPESPDSMAEGLEIADRYWKTGRYEEAGAIYSQLIEAYPALARDTDIRQRIELHDDGTVALLTPVEQVRRASEADPLVITNTSAFRSGRYEGYSRAFREVHYNVTGQVLNRGSEPLRNVELVITIYGFGSRVMETRTVNIGNLRPNDRRPFSTRFSNFEDIENVSRYEVTGYYD